MFIIVGTKHKKINVGWVADVCGFCRDVKPCRFFEVWEVGHLYFIPLGRGKVQAYEVQCETCKEIWGVESGDFRAVMGETVESLEVLIEMTNPDALEDFEQWLELEEHCQSSQGAGHERRQLFFQLIAVLNPNIHQNVYSLGLDVRIWVWVLLMVLLPTPLLMASLVGSFGNGWNQILIGISIAVAVICFGFVLHSLSLRVSRYARRKYRSYLIDSLILFEPSRAELQDVLTMMKDSDMAVGKYLRPDWLYKDLIAAGMPESQRTPEEN